MLNFARPLPTGRKGRIFLRDPTGVSLSRRRLLLYWYKGGSSVLCLPKVDLVSEVLIMKGKHYL